MARYCGDRTADLLGRLSLNPLRHIDPFGTVVVPGLLLAVGGPLIGWAKPVPVATGTLRNPRRAMVWVALAGPLANLAMALLWCGVLGLAVRANGGTAQAPWIETTIAWVELMCQAGIMVNVVLAIFNLLPIPPLDGGRVLAGLLPVRWGSRLEKLEPVGLFVVLGLSVSRLLDWIFEPAFRVVARVVVAFLGSAA